jgi:hypothetical protein
MIVPAKLRRICWKFSPQMRDFAQREELYSNELCSKEKNQSPCWATKSFHTRVVLMLLLIIPLGINATAQTQTFTRGGVEYVLDLPSP